MSSKLHIKKIIRLMKVIINDFDELINYLKDAGFSYDEIHFTYGIGLKEIEEEADLLNEMVTMMELKLKMLS